jgi:beta-lactamase superfamily II metal-dependent hydrolase
MRARRSKWSAPAVGWTGVACKPTSSLRRQATLFRDQRQLSVAILLTYGTARVLLAGDAEAREEGYMANGPYTGPLTVINV